MSAIGEHLHEGARVYLVTCDGRVFPVSSQTYAAIPAVRLEHLHVRLTEESAYALAALLATEHAA
jgi:hypothetical protein